MIADPELITQASKSMFASSETLYDAVKKVADDAGGLEPGEFTGIAEVVEAANLWMNDFIANHRCDIEDLAMFLAVHAETMVETDDYTASQFEQYADQFTDARGTAPAPVRPGPDPEDRMPVDGYSVAV